MSKPFFSIIIPTLNEEKYLPHLLSDLSDQSFKDFEVIIVDGNSKDRTIEKAKLFKDKIDLKILISDKKHVCRQRNLGAKSAKADFLIFSDADNRLPPYFLQGVKYRIESEAFDIASFWIKPDVINPKNEFIATAVGTFLELQNNIKPTYLLESLIVIRKFVFDKTGGFDESINYAEGKSLIHATITLGYTSKVFRDPTYTFSFRRLRKYGVINVASRMARMELSELLGSDFHANQAKKLYPMLGGTLFNKPKKAKNKFLKNITKLLKDF